jgi:hypothetical protein
MATQKKLDFNVDETEIAIFVAGTLCVFPNRHLNSSLVMNEEFNNIIHLADASYSFFSLLFFFKKLVKSSVPNFIRYAKDKREKGEADKKRRFASAQRYFRPALFHFIFFVYNILNTNKNRKVDAIRVSLYLRTANLVRLPPRRPAQHTKG